MTTTGAINFSINSTIGLARAGELVTPHGAIKTPFFMPVGTLAAVKGVTPRELHDMKAQIVLANTYHLALRPGEDIVNKFGGVADFMGWHGPTLTDSGGFQVFSLAKLHKMTDEGVRFQSHIDGSELFLSPETATDIQQKLGADMFMCFDDCPPAGSAHEKVVESLRRTHLWAGRCKEAWTNRDKQALFGIVQGALFEDLRAESAEFISSLDLPGNAIGGVSVGESPEEVERIVRFTAPLLPQDKPRYLMGVGRPQDILMAVGAGVDMFDCVMPTRHARHSQVFTRDGKLNLKNARFREDDSPIEEGCDCYACRTVSRAYLRHLLVAGEMLAPIYLTLHNLRFYIRLMEDCRTAIAAGNYDSFAREAIARMDNA